MTERTLSIIEGIADALQSFVFDENGNFIVVQGCRSLMFNGHLHKVDVINPTALDSVWLMDRWEAFAGKHGYSKSDKRQILKEINSTSFTAFTYEVATQFYKVISQDNACFSMPLFFEVSDGFAGCYRVKIIYYQNLPEETALQIR